MPDTVNQIVDNLQVRGSISGGGVQALAQAVRVACTGDSVGTPLLRGLSSTQVNPGNTGFTIHHVVRPLGYVGSSGARHNSVNNAAGSSVNLPLLFFALSGSDVTPNLFINTVGHAATRTISSANFLLGGEWTVTYTPPSTLAAGSVAFYLDGVPFGSPVTVAAGTPHTFTGSTLILEGTGGSREPANWFETIWYNRTLAASEVLALSVWGPDAADVGSGILIPSQSGLSVVNGDFESWASSTSPDNWSLGPNISASVQQETVGPLAGTSSLRFTGAGTPANGFGHTLYKSGWFGLTMIGKRFRARIKAKRVSGTGSLYIGQGGGQERAISGTVFTNGTTIEVSSEWVVSTVSANASHLVIAAGSGSEFVVDDYTVTQIGVTGWWNAEDCQSDTGQVFDRSGNKGHAVLPSTGATRIPAKREDLAVRGNLTFSASSTAQHVVGVDQVVVPANAIWRTTFVIKSDASVTVDIGDGSDADRYAAAVALTSGYNVVTLLTRTTDGTNRKLVITPSGAITANLEVYAPYDLMET